MKGLLPETWLEVAGLVWLFALASYGAKRLFDFLFRK